MNSQHNSPHPNPIMQMPPHMWREHIKPKASLFDQIEVLPEDEKLMLALHYYEGLTFAEIGKLIGKSEWETIAMHAQALTKLQSRLQEIF
jgi:RNA polymerase sigma factor FliA